MGLWSTGFPERMEEMGLYKKPEMVEVVRCKDRKHKEDCVYYEEDLQMEGRIRTCAKLGEPYKCPCENCDSYLPKSKLHEYIKNQQDEIERLKEKVKKYELEKSWEESPDRMNGSGGW